MGRATRLGATSDWRPCGRLVSENRCWVQTTPLPARNFHGRGLLGGLPRWTVQKWACQPLVGLKMANGRWLGMRKCDGLKRCVFGVLLRARFTCIGGCPRMSLNFHGKEVWSPLPSLKVQERHLEAIRSPDPSTLWDVPHDKARAFPVGAHFGCGKERATQARNHEQKEAVGAVVRCLCRSWLVMLWPTSRRLGSDRNGTRNLEIFICGHRIGKVL